MANNKNKKHRRDQQPEERAVTATNFASLASSSRYNLAATSVTTACKCFSSTYTAPTTTTTVTAAGTTRAVTVGTSTVTTTVTPVVTV